MPGTADIVFVAIQAGVRLYSAGRTAYVEATLARPLALPLPRAPAIEEESAIRFFRDDSQGKIIAARPGNERIVDILKRHRDPLQDTTPEEMDDLQQLYLAYLREVSVKSDGDRFRAHEPTGDELVAILTIEQWSKGEAGAVPPLQRIAGTIVNIAVDYFAHTPGAVSDKRPAGRALKMFLEALDKVDFADEPPGDILGGVLVAVVDSVAANPALFTGSKAEKALITNIATALSDSARKHLLQDVPTDERWEASVSLQMIARAFVKGGAETVLADPVAVLGVDEAEGEVIKKVGSVIADLLIGPDEQNKLRFRELLSGEGINTVVKAALEATAQNPDVLRIDNEGLKQILIGVAEGLATHDNLLTKDIFPEVLGLVLTKSAENLERVWPEGAQDPAKHLLITGTRELFLALSTGIGDDGWPRFSKDQLLGVAETVLDEFVENPDWLVKRADLDNESALTVAVRSSLKALKAHEGARISAEAATSAVTAAIHASAMRLELLKKLPPDSQGEAEVALEAAIGAVLETAFGDTVDDEQKWLRARDSTLAVALEVSMAVLARKGAKLEQIERLREVLGDLIDQRLAFEELHARLEEAL